MKKRILALLIVCILPLYSFCIGANAQEEPTYEMAVTETQGEAADETDADTQDEMAYATITDTQGRVIQRGGLNPGEPPIMPSASLLELTPEEQLALELDNLFCKSWKNRATGINVEKYGLQIDSFADLYFAILNFHPELFYVENALSCSYYVSSGIVTDIYPEYNSEFPSNATQLFDQATDLLLSSAIQPGMTNEEKVLAVHDALVLNCDYDQRLYSNNMPEMSYSAYGAIVEKTAVCQGYALAMNLLLGKLGIPSVFVPSNSMDHGWNVVYLDGEWYHLDATWNDPSTRVGNKSVAMPGYVDHTYFLLSDDGFPKSSGSTLLDHHSWAYWIPDCSSNRYEGELTTLHDNTLGYFYHDGSFVTADNSGIMRVNMDGNQKQILYRFQQDFKAVRMLYYDGALYYFGTMGLCRYDIDANIHTLLKPFHEFSTTSIFPLGLEKDANNLVVTFLKQSASAPSTVTYNISDYLSPCTVGTPIYYDGDNIFVDPAFQNLSKSKLVITNNNSAALSGQVYIAYYSAQDQLMKLTSKKLPRLTGQKTANFTLGTLPSMPQNVTKIKLLLLSADGGFVPLAEHAITVTQTP